MAKARGFQTTPRGVSRGPFRPRKSGVNYGATPPRTHLFLTARFPSQCPEAHAESVRGGTHMWCFGHRQLPVRHSEPASTKRLCSRLIYGIAFTGTPTVPNRLTILERAAEGAIIPSAGAESSTITLDRVRNSVPLQARGGLTPCLKPGGCAAVLLRIRVYAVSDIIHVSRTYP
jgi:hypothetical protein